MKPQSPQKALFLSAFLLLAACGSPEATPTPQPTPPLAPPTVCNGRSELCNRRFNEIAFPGTHNAMSNYDDGWTAANQQHPLRKQLDDGIRVMLLDTHPWQDDIYLCHSICELGHLLLVDGLRVIKTFMDENPYEVITFIMEDGITTEQTVAAFETSGLLTYVYAHPQGEPWPTLYEMLTTQKRLLVTAENESPPPDWYQHAWDLIWDTPYSFKTVSEFSCKLNRGNQENDLFLLNHWLGTPLPSPASATTANEYTLLSGRAKQCQMEGGQLPNFVAVDFYNIGSLFQVVDELNGF